MLVLSRKTNEKIHIGDKVVITVIRINANTVRIGIEAPDDVTIVREELTEPALNAESSERLAALTT